MLSTYASVPCVCDSVCDYRTAVCINIDTLCTMCIQAVLPRGPQCTGAGDESLINNNGFVLAVSWLHTEATGNSSTTLSSKKMSLYVRRTMIVFEDMTVFEEELRKHNGKRWLSFTY